MGGGDHGHGHRHLEGGDFRAKVWSMFGGPYSRPKHGKRNTTIAMVGIVLVCIPIAMKSAELEELALEDLNGIGGGSSSSSSTSSSLSSLMRQRSSPTGFFSHLAAPKLDRSLERGERELRERSEEGKIEGKGRGNLGF